MNKILNAILMLPLVGGLALGGCSDSLTVAEGGIGGSGISTGTVTGIGSITVNGVNFNTDNAAIYVEDTRVDKPDLADGTGPFLLAEGFSEGQVVRVVGSFNADGRTGTADAVYYNDSVEGPVETRTVIDPSTLELVVMGQTVIVDSQTILEPAGTILADIIADELVEVSGLRDETGRIQAGYLEIKGSFVFNGDVEVKGVIANLNTVNRTFEINSGLTSLLVSYLNATELPSSGVQNGMQVEVKGTYDGSQIDALSIEQEDDIGGSDNDEVEYEGIVNDASAYAGQGDSFMLGTQLIQTYTGTIYKGGLDTDVAVGVRLEVEGYLQGNTLIADEVRFRDAIEIDAPVASYDSPSKTIVLDLGPDTLTVQVNELTKISDDANTLNQLENILTNGNLDDYVEVRGRVLSGSVIFAEEIKVKDGAGNPDVKLQGPIENNPVVDPLVTILGIAINVDTHMITEFEGANDLSIDRVTFFNTVLTGNIVSAEGKIVGVGVIDWDKLEIEDEE